MKYCKMGFQFRFWALLSFFSVLNFITQGCGHISPPQSESNETRSSNPFSNTTPLLNSETVAPKSPEALLSETSEVQRPDFSDWIAFVTNTSDGRDIALISPSKREVVFLGLENYRPSKPTWMPGKQSLVFVGKDKGAIDLFLMDLMCIQGTSNNCVDSLANLTDEIDTPVIDPQWCQTDNQLVVSFGIEIYEGQYIMKIGVLDLLTKELHQLGEDDGTDPTCTPDGNFIAYTSNSELGGYPEILFLSRSGTEIQSPLVLPGEFSSTLQGDISPDGEMIAYFGFTGDPLSPDYQSYICVETLDGNTRVLLVEDGEDPSWSPNSGSLVFIRETGLFVVDIWTGEIKQLTSNSYFIDDDPSWSP